MNNQDHVVIVSAVRTPIGSFCGKLSSFKASELGAISIKAALEKATVAPQDVSEVIFGHVLAAGQGQNTARQAAVNAGIPYKVPATQVNMVCGSGLKSVILGCQSIRNGDSRIVVCGGQECMSQARHAILVRPGVKMGPVQLEDTMITDGLTDAFHNYHMGVTAENIAEKYSISRQDQDTFATSSQQKTSHAISGNAFLSEIVPVPIKDRKGGVTFFSTDEFPRSDTTVDILSKLRPVFKPDGTVTAGNASGLNDGAAALVMMPVSEAAKRNLNPLVKLVSYSQVGVDPSLMGMGPVAAVREAVFKAAWLLDEVDLFELNEAFAAQSIAVINELGIDAAKVNVNGGAIALGHPIGASGARILVTLIHAMQTRLATKGVAALCVGGGMGVAVCVERL